MNDLQKLLKIKGVTIRQISRATGAGYHSLQKTTKNLRQSKRMQKVLASYLGVDPALLFGPRRVRIVHTMMEREIEKRSVELRDELRARYLSKEKKAA